MTTGLDPEVVCLVCQLLLVLQFLLLSRAALPRFFFATMARRRCSVQRPRFCRGCGLGLGGRFCRGCGLELELGGRRRKGWAFPALSSTLARCGALRA